MSDDLIKRLESAQGPDRESDLAIVLSLNPGARKHNDEDFYYASAADNTYIPILHYTASIDAALTLVPKGCAVELMIWVQTNVRLVRGDDAWQASFAPTPAIALCIAALRARAELNENRDALL